MNLDDLISSAALHKEVTFQMLDQLKIDVKKIEQALSGFPIDENFEFPVFDEGNTDEVGRLSITFKRFQR